jgi:uncharacterized membrane protein YkoI
MRARHCRLSLMAFALVVPLALLARPRTGAGEDDDAPRHVARAQRALQGVRVPLADAIRTAEAHANGHALRAGLERDDDKLVWEAEVLVAGPPARVVEVSVDALSGAVLGCEDADEENEGEETPRAEKAARHEAGEEEGGEKEERGEDGREEKDGDDEGDKDASQAADKASRPARVGRQGAYTDTFALDPSDLVPSGRNPWFVLDPGYHLVLEKRGAHLERLVISVLDETRVIAGVTTRIVEERETVDGKETEVSRNFFARSRRSNDIYYFGEEGGGGWTAGVAGARAGLFVPDTPLLGARYMMEIAPGVAMDRARVSRVDEVFETPAGRFTGCLRLEETSPLEPGVRDAKVYAPGIGLVYDDGLVLVERSGR